MTTTFAVLATLATTAQADAASYVGKIKGDSGSAITFETVKQGEKRKITEIEFSAADADCENGPGSLSGPIYDDGQIRGGAFDVRYEDTNFKQKFAGKLKSDGKAGGVMKLSAAFDSPTGVCKTAKLRWTASKQ